MHNFSSFWVNFAAPPPKVETRPLKEFIRSCLLTWQWCWQWLWWERIWFRIRICDFCSYEALLRSLFCRIARRTVLFHSRIFRSIFRQCMHSYWTMGFSLTSLSSLQIVKITTLLSNYVNRTKPDNHFRFFFCASEVKLAQIDHYIRQVANRKRHKALATDFDLVPSFLKRDPPQREHLYACWHAHENREDAQRFAASFLAVDAQSRGARAAVRLRKLATVV